MTKEYQPIDPGRIKTYHIDRRRHKATVHAAAALPQAGASAGALLDSLPDYLGASSFREVIRSIVAAHKNDRPVVAAFGAHVIKVGCGPILIDLIRRGIVRAIVCNGACAAWARTRPGACA